MKQNLDSANVSLDDDDMKKIAGLNKNRRYIGGEFWAMPGSAYTIQNLWDE
jgi:alcohol dehydrogenase (NADP+)